MEGVTYFNNTCVFECPRPWFGHAMAAGWVLDHMRVTLIVAKCAEQE